MYTSACTQKPLTLGISTLHRPEIYVSIRPYVRLFRPFEAATRQTSKSASWLVAGRTETGRKFQSSGKLASHCFFLEKTWLMSEHEI